MKVIENNLIPFPGFLAINLFGVLFVRKDAWARRDEAARKVTLNHEAIHTAQMKELLFVFFYIAYFLEWLYRLVFHTSTAYRGISFEVEAYENQNDEEYLQNRRHFAQWRRIERKTAEIEQK